jgi:DNA-binding NarL/FixJ family response regulator
MVSDVRMYREGLKAQLSAGDELDIVAMVDSVPAAVRILPESTPDVVLCDMSLPGGLAAAAAVADAHPGARVVVFAVPDNEVDVPACAEAGVAGFVTREASVADLLAVVQGVARGELVCSPKAAAALYRRVATLSASRAPAAPAARLTLREREIARLIDRGMSNKDIARVLGIELATAKNHVHHILEKLGVERRGDIATRIGRGRLQVTADRESLDRGSTPVEKGF